MLKLNKLWRSIKKTEKKQKIHLSKMKNFKIYILHEI